MMTRTALFPGSFDPITKGHIEIIKRSLLIFDKIIVAVGNNTTKKYLFSLDERVDMVRASCSIFNNKVDVITYNKLTVQLCNDLNVKVIIRGVRTQADFQFEYDIAVNNMAMNPDIQTVLIPAPPNVSHIRSTIVREIYIMGGDISPFVPEQTLHIINRIKKK